MFLRYAMWINLLSMIYPQLCYLLYLYLWRLLMLSTTPRAFHPRERAGDHYTGASLGGMEYFVLLESIPQSVRHIASRYVRPSKIILWKAYFCNTFSKNCNLLPVPSFVILQCADTTVFNNYDLGKSIILWASLWIKLPKYENNQQDALYRLIYYSMSAVHVSGNVFAYHQEHLYVFTVSGSIHPNLGEHYQIL